MLNQDRIRLMTKMAAYEQGEGKEYMTMSRYFRRDYIGLKMIKTFLCSTIAFGILFLLQLLYRLEEFLESMYQIDWQEYSFGIAMRYIIFVIVYQMIAWAVYSCRYRRGQKRQKLYLSRLKKVQKLYEREDKLLPIDNWEDKA